MNIGALTIIWALVVLCGAAMARVPNKAAAMYANFILANLIEKIIEKFGSYKALCMVADSMYQLCQERSSSIYNSQSLLLSPLEDTGSMILRTETFIGAGSAR